MKLKREALAHYLDSVWNKKVADVDKAVFEILGDDIEETEVPFGGFSVTIPVPATFCNFLAKNPPLVKLILDYAWLRRYNHSVRNVEVFWTII